MKLDNRGWGYRDMIIYSSIIIICLVIVVVFSKIMNDNMKASTNSTYDESTYSDNQYYYKIEKEMQDAGFTYLQKNNYSEISMINKIDLNTLIGFGYISMVRDKEDGKVCKGYVQIDVDTTGDYIVSPYLKCTSYITNGYEE